MQSNGVVRKERFWDSKLPLHERVNDLMSHLTLDEKVMQLANDSPSIPRLGIPAYNWWNECHHGVARAGIATVFPQAIALAATWDTDLIYDVATVISDEARAKHHEFARHDDRSDYKGLTYWSPNINIARDPRWGRTQETYGEDPYLTGRIAVAFIKGLQGDHPKYLKLAATPKHFAVHSGPEGVRHKFNAIVTAKDLWETYLPAFKATVVEAKAASVMGAYNCVNGEPCCASKTLLVDILRHDWGFNGYTVSDVGAIIDIHTGHGLAASPTEAAAMSLRNGCDLSGNHDYQKLAEAVDKGMITVAEIDAALGRLLEARFRLGMFDPIEEVSYAQIPYDVVACPKHRQLARKTAQKSIVLLKNSNGLLPLNKDIKNVAVIGPNANDALVLLGNYYGTPSACTTVLDGIRKSVSPDTRVWYAQGCPVTSMKLLGISKPDTHGFSEAVSMAERSEVVIMVMGNSPLLEGEEGEVADSDGGGDRSRLELPEIQQHLIECIHATGKPIVLVMMGGSPIAANWAVANISSILFAWYPGEEGGQAIADIIFGDYNPAGRLPLTFPISLSQLPPFEDYSMIGRTYRYMEGEPLFPFGFGLSYTSFQYSNLELSHEKLTAGESLTVSAEVTNTGDRGGDEVVQLYIQDEKASVRVPKCQLVSFQRVYLASGETKTIVMKITPAQMSMIDDMGQSILEPGTFKVTMGGRSPVMWTQNFGAPKNFVSARFELSDSPRKLSRLALQPVGMI